MPSKRKLKTRICKNCGAVFTTNSERNYCFECRKYRVSGPMAKPTLCWECKKSTAGDDCPWANEFIPVEDWTATPTIIKSSVSTSKYNTETSSYIVIECPLYLPG